MSTGESCLLAVDKHPMPRPHLYPCLYPWDCGGGQQGGQPTVGLAPGLAQAWSRVWPVPCPLAESSLHPPQGVSRRGASPDAGCDWQLSSCQAWAVCAHSAMISAKASGRSTEDGQGGETHVSCSLLLFTCSSSHSIRLSPDASPQQLVNTFHLPSGVGATCVLKTAFNNTLDQPMQTLNLNSNESKMLAAKYFDAMCIDSFTQGLPLSNFVPLPPSPAPSDYPISVDEDLLHAWNSTTFSSAIKGITCAWCSGVSRPGIHVQQGDDISPLQKQLQGPLEVPISLPWPQQSIALLG